MKTVLLVLVGILLLAPLWLMVANSFTDARQFLRFPPRLLPNRPTLANYQAILALPYLGRWAANTLGLVALVVVCGVLVNGAAGYGFAASRSRALSALFWTMMIPIFVTRIVLIVAQFVVTGKLGLRGMPAVFLMSVYWATGIFLFRNYFRTIPASIMESARMDGAGELAILTKIILPLSRPMVGAAVVFLGMGTLGDYLWQMLNLQSDTSKTFIVGLIQSAMYVYQTRNVGYELAIGTVLFIPYITIFSISSRYFVAGLTGGSLKE